MSRELNISKQINPVQTNVENNVRSGLELLKTTPPSIAKLPGGTVMPKPGDALVNNPILGVETKDAIVNADELTTGQKLTGAGIDTLGQLPGIINNFSSKPRSAQEATGKTLNMTMAGAKIGANFGVPGAIVGAAVGFGAGALGNAGWGDKLTDEADQKMIAQQEESRKALIDDYVNRHTSKQIEAQKDLLSSTLGYTTKIG